MATYNITTLQELQDISPTHLADDCVLLNDIDATDSYEWNERAGYPGTYDGFEPIGTAGAPFTGTFDGGGFTVSGLYINTNTITTDGVGLFGTASVASGNIQDVTLKNINYTGTNYIGGIAGVLQGTNGNNYTVDNCHVTGIITSASTGSVIGGVVGGTSYVECTDCTAGVSITSASPSIAYTGIGGFVGHCGSESIFTTCTSGGSLVFTGTGAGLMAGGFVGDIAASGDADFTSCRSSCSIVSTYHATTGSVGSILGGFVGYTPGSDDFIYCYAAGDIYCGETTHVMIVGGFVGYGDSDFDQCAATGNLNCPLFTSSSYDGSVGGFGGYIAGLTVNDCYARGDICETGVSTSTRYNLGGFVGKTYDSTITDCYCTGYVYPMTPNTKGGFVGERNSDTITTCYWDTETSQQTTGAGGGGSQTGLTGATTANMKLEATYTGFDFDGVWDIPTVSQPETSQSNITVWPSGSGDYEDFEEGVNDADAFVVVIPSTNEIRWAESLESLVIGTASDEWKIASNKLDTPLSPTNFGVKQQSNYGSAAIQAVKINEVVLFIDFVARKVREMTWSADAEKFVSPDMTSLAEHITETGIVCMAHQKNPDSILWCVLTDGSLISFVYDREQNVTAWSDHIIDGTVQSVCVVPGSDEDEVWISVTRTITRTIDSSDVVYLEKFATRIQGDIEDSFFVDCGILDTGTSTTITGLDHLEGKTVAALVDGVYDGTFTVSSGEITITTTPTEQTAVGLPYTAILQPMRIVKNGPGGSSMGAVTRIKDLKIVFLNTAGASYGDSESSLYTIDFDDERLVDAAYITDLFSGDVPVNMAGGFSPENPIIISSSQPLPMTVKAIIASFEQTGR